MNALFTEKYLATPRGNVFYWMHRCDDASAPVLVLLHGLSANHHLFDQQMAYFSQNYTILVWDAPAQGKSRPYRDFSYPHAADDLKNILDKESVDEAIFITQSAGGFVFQSFYKKYPAVAKGFVAIGTCPYEKSYYSKSDIFWLRQTKWMFHLFPQGILQYTMAKMCARTPRAYQNMRQMLANYERKELIQLLYQGFAGFIPEITDHLPIACPVCLILGEKDYTGKVRHYNRAWHEKEGYPLHIIKNAAHNTNDDAPDEVNAIIEQFVKSI